MWDIKFKVIIKDEKDEIQKIALTILKDTEVYRKFDVKVDDIFIVNSVKKNKKRHRGRQVKVYSFVKNYNGGLRVRVRFLENGRLGYVDLDDLDKI